MLEWYGSNYYGTMVVPSTVVPNTVRYRSTSVTNLTYCFNLKNDSDFYYILYDDTVHCTFNNNYALLDGFSLGKWSATQLESRPKTAAYAQPSGTAAMLRPSASIDQ